MSCSRLKETAGSDTAEVISILTTANASEGTEGGKPFDGEREIERWRRKKQGM